MKRAITLFLAVIVLLQLSFVSLAAESSQHKKAVITISNIDTALLFDDSPRFTTEIRVDGVASSRIKIVGEKWLKPEEFFISVKDVPLEAGKYSYQLKIKSDGTLNFNNDLDIIYQGIDGNYKLDYTIDETDNHIMIVTGVFRNIITASPALDTLPERSKNWVLENISDDSYAYELNLRTQEGFTFSNKLQYMFRSTPCVYSLGYLYELLDDHQVLTVNGAIGSDFAYYARLACRKETLTDLSDRIDSYNRHLDEVLSRNEEVLSKANEGSELLASVSALTSFDTIEGFAIRNRDFSYELRDHIDISLLSTRVQKFFEIIGR